MGEGPDKDPLVTELRQITDKGLTKTDIAKLDHLCELLDLDRSSGASDSMAAIENALNLATAELDANTRTAARAVLGIGRGVKGALRPRRMELASKACRNPDYKWQSFVRNPLTELLTDVAYELRKLATGSPSRSEKPKDRSEFIRDVTVPDGLMVSPGEKFTKTWEIRNAGSVPWVGRWLARIGSTEGPGIPSSPPQVPIPDTQPGETVQISVPMQASALPGTSVTYWKMTDGSGKLFFPDRYRYGLVVEITVVES